MDTRTPYYLLRWSDHLSNYSEIFLTLREEEEFVDCSIACEDGVVSAHRVVLAGCSPYLRTLFKRADNPHPIIFLLNVPRSTVLLLMEFIYKGQAHIPYNCLHQLVTLGQSMQIKGLSQIKLPDKHATLLTRSLPIIPRLHGASDHVTEVINESCCESNSTLSMIGEDLGNSMFEEDNLTAGPPKSSSTATEENEIVSEHQQEHESNQENDINIQDNPNVKKQIEKEKQSSIDRKQKGDVRNMLGTNRSLRDQSFHENMNENNVVVHKSSNTPQDIRDSPYVPRPKSKQMKQCKKDIPCASKSNKSVLPRSIQEHNILQNAVKEKEKRVTKRGRPPSSKAKVKGKPAALKLKKKSSYGNIKKEPKNKLYNANLQIKSVLGDYALRHGIEASQRYVLAKYGVNIRRKSLENMISLCKSNRKKLGFKKGTPKKKSKV